MVYEFIIAIQNRLNVLFLRKYFKYKGVGNDFMNHVTFIVLQLLLTYNSNKSLINRFVKAIFLIRILTKLFIFNKIIK